MSPSDGTDATQELAVLSFATRLLLAELDRKTLIERGLESLADFSGASKGAIFLLDAKGEYLVAEGALGCEAHAGLRLSVAGTPFEEVMRSGQSRSFPLEYQAGVPCPASSPTSAESRCLCIPLVEAHNRVIGVAALEQPAGGTLDPVALQCLLIVQSVLAISLENARALADLKELHAQLEVLNRAKTKMINHLSHELKTPLAVLSASSKLLRNAALRRNDARADSVLDRMERNIGRLLELQGEAGDIAGQKDFQEKRLLDGLLRRCQDVIETFADEHDAPDGWRAGLSRRIQELYGEGEEQEKEAILLHEWIPRAMESWGTSFRHRGIRVEQDLTEAPAIHIPESPLYKALGGLVRNAVENTPDGGTVRIEIRERDGSVWLSVRDNGVGIDEELQQHLFHGFVHAGSTDDYSSGRPYDFRAGGQGLDLLRTKLFSERYGFRVTFESEVGVGSAFTLEFPEPMLLTRGTESCKRVEEDR